MNQTKFFQNWFWTGILVGGGQNLHEAEKAARPGPRRGVNKVVAVAGEVFLLLYG